MPPTTRNIGFSQLRVGIFVLIALALLAFLIINSSGEFNPFEKRMRLKAHFASADGLREGAEVQLAGVHIGQVEQVRFLPPDSEETSRIEAIMSVSETLDGRPVTERIRTDSTAQLIATSVLANDKMINITPGSARGGAVEENHVLDSSTSISINQLTQTGNELLTQINKLAVPTNEILNKANRGEGSAGKLLNDPELYNSLNRTTAQLEAIARDLRAGRGSAGKFLSDDQLYNETRATILEVRASVNRLTQVADSFETIARDLNEGKGTAGKFLKDEQLYNDARDTLAKFNSTATKLDVMLADAQSGKGTIGKLLTDETLYNNANQTMSNVNQLSSEGTKLIYDFRQNPKKYLTIRFRLF
ncbi:MAG TPA: MlaD family protein [Pyrinomonadaceae bacterium]|nr:MlaD family protein [Pyrinomonadaceae bacterium]